MIVECVSRLKPYTRTVDDRIVGPEELERFAKQIRKAVAYGDRLACVFDEFNPERMIGRVVDAFVDRRGLVTVARVSDEDSMSRHFMTGGKRVLPRFDWLKTRVTRIGAVERDENRDLQGSFHLLDGKVNLAPK